jgi:hypothetical protein
MSLDSRFPELSKEHTVFTFKDLEVQEFLCSVDRVSLYNLVNKTKLFLFTRFENVVLDFLASVCDEFWKY